MTCTPNENGFCPHCKANLDGGDIIETFIKQGNTPERAAEIASNYGYKPGHTQWGRQIGLEYDNDYIEEWQCPDCSGKWPRNFKEGRV